MYYIDRDTHTIFEVRDIVKFSFWALTSHHFVEFSLCILFHSVLFEPSQSDEASFFALKLRKSFGYFRIVSQSNANNLYSIYRYILGWLENYVF